MALQQLADNIVTYTQRLGIEQAANADNQTAQRRPPHPVNGQEAKAILASINGHSQQGREGTGQQPDQRAGQDIHRANKGGMRRGGEQWSQADDIAAQHIGGNAGERDRDQAARLPLEEQQFNRQQHRSDGGGKGRSHTSGSSSHQQGLTLAASQTKKLREHRTKGTAGHDNRSLRAKRPA